MRVIKDGENYWFGWKVILMWHNPCRELQTSAAQQCLVERCLSHPTSPCCTQSSWGSATLPSDFHPDLYMLARGSKIFFIQTSYGQSLDAAFLPPQGPKQSLSSRVWESLSFQHIRWELALDDSHMDSESGCCEGGVSSDSGVFKFLKPEYLLFQSLKPGFHPHWTLSSHMLLSFLRMGISSTESLCSNENSPNIWAFLTTGLRLRLNACLEMKHTPRTLSRKLGTNHGKNQQGNKPPSISKPWKLVGRKASLGIKECIWKPKWGKKIRGKNLPDRSSPTSYW